MIPSHELQTAIPNRLYTFWALPSLVWEQYHHVGVLFYLHNLFNSVPRSTRSFLSIRTNALSTATTSPINSSWINSMLLAQLWVSGIATMTPSTNESSLCMCTIRSRSSVYGCVLPISFARAIAISHWTSVASDSSILAVTEADGSLKGLDGIATASLHIYSKICWRISLGRVRNEVGFGACFCFGMFAFGFFAFGFFAFGVFAFGFFAFGLSVFGLFSLRLSISPVISSCHSCLKRSSFLSASVCSKVFGIRKYLRSVLQSKFIVGY